MIQQLSRLLLAAGIAASASTAMAAPFTVGNVFVSTGAGTAVRTSAAALQVRN